ncbi:hypothetical protein COCON_G00232270 [Conger conger]|uniref:Uncharacterized protein n=1 Tax=Conger conger TaxID=82655 RepID=A0A9Q1CVH0_CONCO|nr:hypothetical protein COCON_G00232270 [Conger conger]
MPPQEQLLLRVHHQAPDAEPVRLPRLRIPGFHAARGGVRGTGFPRVLSGAPGLRLPHGGHLPGVGGGAFPGASAYVLPALPPPLPRRGSGAAVLSCTIPSF